MLAARPRSDPDRLRASYLDVLKLCLCDLGGARTREVIWDQDEGEYSREFEVADEYAVSRRLEGRDWPLDGLTMVGLLRLDNLQACVESVVRDEIEGDLIEAGAWRGGASILIRATLDSLGADERTLWVADSFQGFPEPREDESGPDRELEEQMSAIGFLAPTLEQVRGYFARLGCERGVNFVPGFFEETLGGLRGRQWSLIRLDADTYRATKLALEILYPGLAAGGYLIVDDYFHPYLPESCRKAVDEFRDAHGIAEPIEQVDWTGAWWRRESEPALWREDPDDAAFARRDGSSRPTISGRATAPIPTDRELRLERRIAALERRLRAVKGQLSKERGARADSGSAAP